jgi:kumamolisin
MARIRSSEVARPEDLVPILGSERGAAPSTQRLGPADPNEVFTVTICTRRRPDGAPVPDHRHFLAVHPGQWSRMSEAEFSSQYGASLEDIEKVKAFVDGRGLEVLGIHSARRTIIVKGDVAKMNAAFGVDLGRYERASPLPNRGSQRENYRGREGVVSVPRSLADIVVGVFGLDDRSVGGTNGAIPPGTTTVEVPTVARLYNYPANSAEGQTIGIFSRTGYAESDIAAYFEKLARPPPTLKDILLNGKTNDGVDGLGETTQDIEIAAAFAPGANINVYITTRDQQGWVQAINRVAHPDPTDASPSVLSCSYFIAEGDDPAAIAHSFGASIAFVNAVSSALQDAAMRGVTVCVSSGDHGTDSQVGDGKAHVQYPASDPWVLSVGGTTIGNISESSFDEYVWNDPDQSNRGVTGGGVSALFPVPSYQATVNIPASINDPSRPGRGVPDVAGNANKNSGYSGLVFGGVPTVGDGTSAAAPQWAGLIAVINAALGFNVGFVNPALYALESGCFRDILPGAGPTDNGNKGVRGYPAGPGWDACTGWGSPNGQQLLSGLKSFYAHADQIDVCQD